MLCWSGLVVCLSKAARALSVGLVGRSKRVSDRCGITGRDVLLYLGVSLRERSVVAWILHQCKAGKRGLVALWVITIALRRAQGTRWLSLYSMRMETSRSYMND